MDFGPTTVFSNKMEFADILRLKIKPELNTIYHRRPFVTGKILDLGWFCREHAFHLYIVSRLLGHQAQICVGDFWLSLPDKRVRLSSADAEGDHAWCSIDGVSPVDISATLKYASKDTPDISLVYGCSTEDESPCRIECVVDPLSQTAFSQTEHNRLVYQQKAAFEFDPASLLEEPYQFLHVPAVAKLSFPSVYGSDVFYRMSYHCYRIAIGEARPLHPYRNWRNIMPAIVKFNENAKKEVLTLLGRD
jgi:hypothetical protein